MKHIVRLLAAIKPLLVTALAFSAGFLVFFVAMIVFEDAVANLPFLGVLIAIVLLLASTLLFLHRFDEEEIKQGEEVKPKFKEDFEKAKAEFLKQFDDIKPKSTAPVIEPQEIFEADEFKGDAVYDNLDNIFDYAAKANATAEPIILDAEIVSMKDYDDYATMTVSELKALCKRSGIKGYSAMLKGELVEILEKMHNRAPKE